RTNASTRARAASSPRAPRQSAPSGSSTAGTSSASRRPPGSTSRRAPARRPRSGAAPAAPRCGAASPSAAPRAGRAPADPALRRGASRGARSLASAMGGSIAGVPELPDVELYRTALRERLVDRRLEAVRVAGPSWLRTVEPPLAAAPGRRVRDVRRLGKRLVLALEADDDGESWFLVLHLMVAGRLHWKPRR